MAPDDDGLSEAMPHRWYQGSRLAQRVMVTLDPVHGDWFDTGIHPVHVGLRPMTMALRAKVLPRGRDQATLVACVGNIEIRVVPDPSCQPTRRFYTFETDLPVLPVGEVVRLATGDFVIPNVPGRLEARFAGLSRADTGTTRLIFVGPTAAPDDRIVADSSMDLVEQFVDLDELPNLPPL